MPELERASLDSLREHFGIERETDPGIERWRTPRLQQQVLLRLTALPNPAVIGHVR